jgi:hypothetical protein
MMRFLLKALICPFKIAAWCLATLGRTAALVGGLIGFGIGALCCSSWLLIIIGAPLCLISAIVVVKAV